MSLTSFFQKLNLFKKSENISKELMLNLDSTKETKYYLSVPYAEKDTAKSLGALWDPQRKQWYILDNVDRNLFQQWDINKKSMELSSNIRSQEFFIMTSPDLCWSCKRLGNVFGFLLLSGFEYEDINEDDETIDENDEYIWVKSSYPVIVNFVSLLNNEALHAINNQTNNYYYDFSKTTDGNYYMNHCEHCGSKLGDFFLHCEPEGPFFPLDEKDAEHIRLKHFNYKFEANATFSSVNFMEYMKVE